MPSKRKKNRRRMRRVQALKRAFEDQHTANPLVKPSRGIAVNTPPAATPKKAAETPKAPPSTKLPQPPPVSTAGTPNLELKPVEKEPVAESVPESDSVLQKQTPAEVKDKVLSFVTEEAPVVEAPRDKPSTGEAGIDQQEGTEIVPETQPVTEVQTVETKTETEKAHEVYEPETEKEAEVLPEEDTVTKVVAEAAFTEVIAAPEPETEASDEGLSNDQANAEADAAADGGVKETVSETVEEVIPAKDEQVTEAAVSPVAAPQEGEDEGIEEELAAEKPRDIPVEPLTTTEDPPVHCVEIPVGNADTQVDDAIVPESVTSVEVSTVETAAAQPEVMGMSDTVSTQTETPDMSPGEPEPAVAAPANNVDDGAAADADQTHQDMLSGEDKTQTSDQCQMQIAVEAVQLNSGEIPVETKLNEQIAQEVSIEG
ncbi:uncharacterized protein KZ484_003937 [Pholidichthys leucotaenia]